MNNLANKTVPTSTKPLFVGIDLASGNSHTAARTITNSVISTPLKNERAICEMVSAISTLAILSREVLHIETRYTAVTNELEVKVFRATTNYFGGLRRMLFRCIYLDNSNALNELKTLEDQLIDLVAEAKDKAMGAC